MAPGATNDDAGSGDASPANAGRAKRPAPRYWPKPLAGAVAPVEHMRRRADFLAARAGERRGGSCFTMEVLDRTRADPSLRDAPPRLGLTVTKKVGGAVLRNRIRRRLREAVRTAVAEAMLPGHDYVLVARPEAASVPFKALVDELRERVAAPMRPDRSGRGRGRRPRGGPRGRSGGKRGGGAKDVPDAAAGQVPQDPTPRGPPDGAR